MAHVAAAVPAAASTDGKRSDHSVTPLRARRGATSHVKRGGLYG